MHHESTPGITQELGDDARQKREIQITKALYNFCCV